MSRSKPKPEKGIEVRHARTCPAHARSAAACRCTPTYRPRVWDADAGTSGRWINGPAFPAITAARNWRYDAIGRVGRGELRAPTAQTIKDAADALMDGMTSGLVLDRSGKPYKAATCRSYAQGINGYLVPALGHMRVSAVRRRDVQRYVDELRGRGLSPRTVLNKLDPLRVIFRLAMRDDFVSVDPTEGLELPRVRSGRKRVESPARARGLIDALPESDRAFWTMALFTGLRRGELRALRWSDIDLKAKIVRVERSWDDAEGEQATKSEAGERSVPLMSQVRRELAEHKLRTGRGGDDLVFGRTADLPFVPTTVRTHALKAWKTANDRVVKAAEEAGVEVDLDELLQPLTPHEARHCTASYLIAAGVDPKQLSTYMGHSSIKTTYDIYGHLLPGNEAESADKLDVLFDEAADA